MAPKTTHELIEAEVQNNSLTPFEIPKKHLLAKATLVAGGLACAVSCGLAKPNRAQARPDLSYANTPAIPYVGVTTGEIINTDLSVAETIAQKIQDLGANSVRFPLSIGPGQVAIEYDAPRLCNAIKAAEDHNLHVTIDTWGVHKDGTLGYMPDSGGAYKTYAAAMRQMVWLVGGPNGCTKTIKDYQPLKDFNVEIFNEPNNPTFNDALRNPITAAEAPANYINTLIRAYPTIKLAASEVGANVNVIAGALSSNRNPLGFIAAMGVANTQLNKADLPLFNWFSFHPYEYDSSISPLQEDNRVTGVIDYPSLVNALKKAFGYVKPIDYDEFGTRSEIPILKRGLYRHLESGSPLNPVNELVQAQFYHDYFALAACQRAVIETDLFQLDDDGYNWQSGLFYPDGTPKSSAVLVQQYIAQTRSGTITTC